MMNHSTFLIYCVYTISVVCVCMCVCALLTFFIFNHINGFWICEMKCICLYVNEICYSGMLCSVDRTNYSTLEDGSR